MAAEADWSWPLRQIGMAAEADWTWPLRQIGRRQIGNGR